MQFERPPQMAPPVPFQVLSEVSEAGADNRLTALFDDIKRVFEVGHLHGVFRALALYPDDLERLWQALRSNSLSSAFDSAANQIRAEALRMVAPFPTVGCDLPLLARLGYLQGDIDHLRSGAATFHYLNPQLLLWVAAARTLLQRPLGQSPAPKGLEAPAFGNPLIIHLVPPQWAPPEVAARYRGLQQLLGAPVIHSEFQFLGGFPSYLYHLYPALQQFSAARGFREASLSLGSLAEQVALTLPFRTEQLELGDGATERLHLFADLLPPLILLMAQVCRRLSCAQEWYLRGLGGPPG